MAPQDQAALVAALMLAAEPSASRRASASHLPAGVSFLLEIAAGNADAMVQAKSTTRRSEFALRSAAEFYIEQVLLNRASDSYRILGGTRSSSAQELRRNFALLMKWLHPDVADGAVQERHVFVTRITQAWETLKTVERRATYDATLDRPEAPREPSKATTRNGQKRTRSYRSRTVSRSGLGTHFAVIASLNQNRHEDHRTTLARWPLRISRRAVGRLLNLLRGRP